MNENEILNKSRIFPSYVYDLLHKFKNCALPPQIVKEFGSDVCEKELSILGEVKIRYAEYTEKRAPVYNTNSVNNYYIAEVQ